MPNTIRIMIVDDEAHCRSAVRYFVTTGCPEAQIVGEADSLATAAALLPQLNPDLLFLDVSLEDGTGFDLLDRFPRANFRVIFITAHDDFALRAFRYSAIDYLLKPIDPEELITAVRRVATPLQPLHRQQQFDQLRHNATTRRFDRITLNTGDGLLFIQTDEIMHLEANGNYSFVFLENGERHLTAQSLTAFEEMLSAPPFFRTHQSHVVNTKFVRKLAKDDGESLLMTDKSVIPLARRRKEAFIRMMENLA